VDGALGGTTAPLRSAFNNGIATVSDLSWSEVGVITLTATNINFLGNALTTTGTSANVGRFYPDHFDTSVVQVAGVPMDCPTGLTCPLAYNGFIYSGQPFSLQVTAKNVGGNTTSNYQGSYAKAVTLGAVTSHGGVVIAAAAPGGVLSANSVAATDFSAGSNSVTPARPIFTFATAPTLPMDVYVRAVDTDVVSSLRVVAASSTEGGVKVVSGRFKVPNVYGSERLPLPVTATVQYFDGSSWVTSLTDSVTAFDSNLWLAGGGGGNLAAADVPGSPACAVSVISPGSTPVTAGIRTLTLAAPQVRCSAAISLNAPTYLPSSSGRATFGIFKSPLIYRRENY
jgi:MSHA biogenesis protein MshQ